MPTPRGRRRTQTRKRDRAERSAEQLHCPGAPLSSTLLQAIADRALRPREGELRSSGGFYADATDDDRAIWTRISLDALRYGLAPFQAVEAVKRKIPLRDAAKYQGVVEVQADGLFVLWNERVATEIELEEELGRTIACIEDGQRSDRDARALVSAQRSEWTREWLVGGWQGAGRGRVSMSSELGITAASTWDHWQRHRSDLQAAVDSLDAEKREVLSQCAKQKEPFGLKAVERDRRTAKAWLQEFHSLGLIGKHNRRNNPWFATDATRAAVRG